MLPPAPPRAGRHPALEPKGCLGRRALRRQAESPSSRAERSSPRQPSLGPSACLAWPAWPPACLLQRSASLPLPAPPPQLCGHLCPGPGLQQLRPAAQPAHERRGRLPGHHPGRWALAKQGPARLLRPGPWARPHPGQGSLWPRVAALSSHRLRLTCTSRGRPAPSSRPVSGSKSPRRRLTCPGRALPAHGSLSPEARACGLPHVTRVCPPSGLGLGPSAGLR